MDITEAIHRLQQEADQLSLRRNALQHELEDVRRQELAVTSNLKSLQDVAVHFGVIPSDDPDDDEAPTPEWWIKQRRQAAVLAALISLGRPVHLREILSFLQSTGRSDDNTDLISAALSALRGKGQAEPSGNGVWALTGANDTPEALRYLFSEGAAAEG